MFRAACQRFASAILLLSLLSLLPALSPADTPPAIQPNSNRVAAGTIENGSLALHLELRQGRWFPGADTGPSMAIYAFGEASKPLQIPGPLIRVPEGMEIHVTVRNLLPAAAVLHGLHSHPGDAKDVVALNPGEVRYLTFVAGVPGTYQYWASAGGSMTYTANGRPYQEDSQLAGAFIVDPRGGSPPDRVFVLGLWRSEADAPLSDHIPVVNGKSWPYTERLTYAAGEPVRWRVVNASDGNHPMHLHGSYYRVDSAGDGESDHVFPDDQRATVVTHALLSGHTVTTSWTPPPGRWLVHCHLLAHIRPISTVNQAVAIQSGQNIWPHDESAHGLNHMGGMVVGITVTGKYVPVASHGGTQKLRLLVRERPAENGLAAGYSYQLEGDNRGASTRLTVPGPPLVLERGRPVDIEVVNQLHEATTVHWHGVELQSYYDGVSGWDGDGSRVTPRIEPGHSFHARFTPVRAGTFIYHTHLNDEVQLSGGLYGPVIVLEPGAKFDPATDVVFLMGRDGPDPVRAPLLLNGSAAPPVLHWRAGQRYRLRLINITPSATANVHFLGPPGLLRWRAIAKDGADLPPLRVIATDAQQSIMPGEVYDFEYQPAQAGRLKLEVEVARSPLKVVQAIEVE
jgi:FtsP/CotA-like multicopper oxidase with cupredoxin domain